MMLLYYLHNLLKPQIAHPVIKVYETSNLSGSILTPEICKAVTGAKSVLTDLVLDDALKELYALQNSTCSKQSPTKLHCLYMYLYAIDSWENEGTNYLNEKQLISLLSNVEQISKSCCNG
jgi:hypothetical protein